MYPFYDVAVHTTSFFLRILARFHPKVKLFVSGRKHTFATLRECISVEDRVLWIHAASLGEYEQGLPIVKKLRANYPGYKLLLSFFSPSGYEVKKNSKEVDVVVYLPLDTQKNVKAFLDLVNPSLAIFVKYEIWPNYLRALQVRQIPTVLISALFKKNQIFFQWYGGFLRSALAHFTYIFVQNDSSLQLLEKIGITNTSISGDTRFDRVTEIVARDNSLDFMAGFKKDDLCFVAGSTWPEDEAILVPHINATDKCVKYVLAPHNIKEDHLVALQNSISKPNLRYSELEHRTASDVQVLIIDTIGLLTKIYSYADLAYVGGAFATGLHNTLEPAVFGVPVIIGPAYHGFREAEDLVAAKGLSVVKSGEELTEVVTSFLEDSQLRHETGRINADYIARNKGASIQIMEYLRTLL